MSKVMRLSLDREYPFQYREDKEGNLVYHSDYAALEARVKAAEDAADKYLHEAKRHQRALLAAEAELERLKAQEPLAPNRQKLRDPVDVVWSDAAETPVYLSYEWADKLINQVFSAEAEPRPAVLPAEMVVEPEKHDVIDHGFIAGYNKCRADALALGCQPQRFVVKIARDTKISPRAHDTQQAYAQGWNDRGQADKEAIRAAGVEIAE